LIIWLITKRAFPEHAFVSLIALVMIIAGGLFLFYQGAITKLPCTVSYCLFTTGLSIYLLMISEFYFSQVPIIIVFQEYLEEQGAIL